MRFRFVLVLAFAAMVAGAVIARAQVVRPGPTYPLWEYRTETTRGIGTQELSESALNGLGREGWELIALTRREIRVQDTMQTEAVYVFKRSRGDAGR